MRRPPSFRMRRSAAAGSALALCCVDGRYPAGTCRVVGGQAADAGELGQAPLDRPGTGRSRTHRAGVRERLEKTRGRRATRRRQRYRAPLAHTRFLARRLDGLADEPRPGVPRTITDAQVEEVVVRTLEQTPQGGTHWSKRELAKVVGISPASVLRIWHAFGLQPRRTETFKITPDLFLIDKIRDVVGLYLAPPANAVVFAMDEKPQIQALERTAQVLPMIPGVPERRSLDYVRHGTVDLFAAPIDHQAGRPSWPGRTVPGCATWWSPSSSGP